MSDLKQTALELANTHNAEPAAVVARAAAYLAFLSGSATPAAGAATTTTKTTAGATAGATAPDAAAKAKAAADAKAKADAAAKVKATAEAAAKAKAAAAGGPAPGTKAPGGKHSVDEVRAAIRTVATTASLGKQSATDILADDGGGVTKVTDLKPEFYDAVYDACQALLNNEGGEEGAAAAEDDLM